MSEETTAPPDRADLRTVACAPLGAGTRWAAGWHALFYGTLALGVALALPDGETAPGQWAIVAVLAVWYGVGAWRLRPTTPTVFAVVYVGGLVGLWAVLVWQRGEYTAVAPSLFITAFGFLPWTAALPAAFAVSAGTVLPQIRAAGGVDVGHVVTAGLLFGVAVAVARSFQTIATQSEERRRLLEALQAARAELADAERETVRLAERQRLAADIHDTLTQGFASIVMLLEAASASLRDGEAARHVRLALDTARDNLAEARRLVWSTRPDILAEGGLAAAVQRAAAQMRDRTGLTVTVQVEGSARRLPIDVEVAVLRAAQEALANVERHADATAADVTLTFGPDRVGLQVGDDGRGFDPDRSAPPGEDGRVGLVAMRERVASVGGTVRVDSVVGAGTTVVVEIPVAAPVADTAEVPTR